MPDHERVVYPYGPSGRGYRINYKTFVYHRVSTIIGGIVFICLSVLTIVIRNNVPLFVGIAVVLLTFIVQLAIARFGQLAGEPIYQDRIKSHTARFLLPLHRVLIKVSVVVLSVMVSLSVWQTVRTGQGVSLEQATLIVLVLFGIVLWRGIDSNKSNRPKGREE